MSAPTWLGIDLGGTSIKWEQVTVSGEAVNAGRVPTPADGQLAVSDALAAIINDALASAAPPAGVGIAVPGHLSPQRDSITLLPNVAGDWLGFPLVARLRDRTGNTPTLLNDARAFAGAEHAVGGAAGSSDVVFVTIGTGIGGAIAIDGAVLRSRRDTLGELGHTTAVVDGERCGCGHRGCVEAYAGGAAVLRRAAQHGLIITPGPDALRQLASRAATSRQAAKILTEAYEALAVGVSSACAFSGARLVVIGGGVADELPGYLDRCQVRLESRRALLGEVEVRRATLGVRAGAVGAAFAAREAGPARSTTLGARPGIRSIA